MTAENRQDEVNEPRDEVAGELESLPPPDEWQEAVDALSEAENGADGAEMEDDLDFEPLALDDPGVAIEDAVEPEEVITAAREELKPVVEAILFVAEEPLPFKQLCKLLGDVREDDVRSVLDELVAEYEARGSGLEFREIAGGWRISTRPQHHEFIRKYLKSRPTARLSLPALETLAVIAYKQPITVPEILEIRGVTSSSAIKTLLEKRLIVTKGRKETVGRPMMYGTSKEFLIQFGLKDLNELPSMEDFEDLAQ
jgi:segregation and condensation protein B